MAERRSKRIVVNIEPSIEAAFKRLLFNMNPEVSPPEYLRKLIINDLKEKGFINDKIIVAVTT